MSRAREIAWFVSDNTHWAVRTAKAWRRRRANLAETYTLGYQAGFGERLRQDTDDGLRPRLSLVQ